MYWTLHSLSLSSVSVQPESIREVLFHHAARVSIPPCALSNQERDPTIGVCLKVVPSPRRHLSLPSFWGKAICAIRSAADFKNYEGASLIIVGSWSLSRGGARRSLLHLTHPSTVMRSTGTCARSSAGFLLHSELPAPAASPGWRGPCRLGRGSDRGGAGGWRRTCCRRWPPMQLWTVLSCSLQIPSLNWTAVSRDFKLIPNVLRSLVGSVWHWASSKSWLKIGIVITHSCRFDWLYSHHIVSGLKKNQYVLWLLKRECSLARRTLCFAEYLCQTRTGKPVCTSRCR